MVWRPPQLRRLVTLFEMRHHVLRWVDREKSRAEFNVSLGLRKGTNPRKEGRCHLPESGMQAVCPVAIAAGIVREGQSLCRFDQREKNTGYEH